MKQTAMKYLPQEYFILDEDNETYRLCNEISQYVPDANFVQAYKAAVEFLEDKYFGNEGGEDRVKGKEVTDKTQEDVINHIHSYITSQGYEYDNDTNLQPIFITKNKTICNISRNKWYRKIKNSKIIC